MSYFYSCKLLVLAFWFENYACVKIHQTVLREIILLFINWCRDLEQGSSPSSSFTLPYPNCSGLPMLPIQGPDTQSMISMMVNKQHKWGDSWIVWEWGSNICLALIFGLTTSMSFILLILNLIPKLSKLLPVMWIEPLILPCPDSMVYSRLALAGRFLKNSLIFLCWIHPSIRLLMSIDWEQKVVTLPLSLAISLSPFSCWKISLMMLALMRECWDPQDTNK